MSKIIGALLFAPLMALPVSCMDRTLAEIEPIQSVEERVRFDVSQNRDVDILFVIDNSNSMEREQASLAAKFSNLIATLADHEDGLPSVHIAVTSTDLGVGPGNALCSSTGDDGAFLGGMCEGMTASFLQSLARDDGTRDENFSGSIEDTFACMATLGNRGCGFEQPLEAMRRALSRPQANSFLRDHAYLAVILVSDEDDCSVHDPAMFDPAIQDLGSHLGPPKSYRCFEFGVECDQDPRTPGARSGCVPRSNSPYLHDVEDYVAFLHDLKPFPTQVMVATIAGDMEPLEVVKEFDSNLQVDALGLKYSCTREDAEAVPPIRLNAFVDAFADAGAKTSICQEDLSQALEDIARIIIARASPCLQGVIADLDPQAAGVQPDCVASEKRPGREERLLPECDEPANPSASSVLPCYFLSSPERCQETPSGLSPEIVYAEGVTREPGTEVTLSCAAGES